MEAKFISGKLKGVHMHIRTDPTIREISDAIEYFKNWNNSISPDESESYKKHKSELNKHLEVLIWSAEKQVDKIMLSYTE
jgi:hypothetical protein